MVQPNVTILMPAGGKDLKVLACSVDAGVCLDAFTKCEKPGEVFYIRKGSLDKRKSIKAKPKKA